MTLRSSRAFVLDALRSQAGAALKSAGEFAVQSILQVMRSGYGSPIRETGALMADVTARVDELTLVAGNRLTYAVPVHEGTVRSPGRPYLRDGFLQACPGMMTLLRQGLSQ